jgi:histidyl-tRNA synthetase
MIRLIRGFRDILPGETELWQHIETTAREIFTDFGFRELKVPIMERTELFARSIGAETDIVQKEMYTFADRKKDMITLRPEATASVVRSYIQQKMYATDPVQKLFTIGPMFRRERPQKGRYRQFYQIDAEVFGVASPLVDAQMILLLVTLFNRLAVNDARALVNSLGCPGCRPKYKKKLDTYLEAVASKLCDDCSRRRKTNPLRVLDCKVASCRKALVDVPAISDSLCDECSRDFDIFQKALTDQKIPFEVDKYLVRGLDYYNRTTFEIQTGALGAQNAVAGGGRYDGLVKMLGGPNQPATGFAVGLDRLAEITGLKAADFTPCPDLFIAALGPESQAAAFAWHCALGLRGVHSEMDFGDRSLKSQMKRANRLKARHVLIVGENELDNGAAIFRNMVTKKQVEIPLKTLVDQLGIRLKSSPANHGME